MSNATSLLKLSEVDVFYENIQALFGVTFEVPTDSLIAILGNNGAGKSTTLLSISGILLSKSGYIEFANQKIQSLPPNQRVKLGISLVPQGRQIFPGLTIRENLLMGAYTRDGRTKIEEDIEKIYQYFPVLGKRQKEKGGTLSGGQQQMLAIGRGLISRPRLLLLDEPSIGLAPKLVQWIYQTIPILHRKEHNTILLVEQMAVMALQVCEFAYVIQSGRIIMSGKPEVLMGMETIKTAYLGSNL